MNETNAEVVRQCFMGRRITSYMNGGKTKGFWGLLMGAHGGSIKLNIVSVHASNFIYTEASFY